MPESGNQPSPENGDARTQTWLSGAGRLVVGLAFLIAGSMKAISSHAELGFGGGVRHGPAAFVSMMRDQGVVPLRVLDGVGWWLAAGIIAGELLVGMWLILGRGRAGRRSAAAGMGLLIVFQVYLATLVWVAAHGGTDVACWCFGGLGGTSPEGAMVRNVVLCGCLVPGVMWGTRRRAGGAAVGIGPS